MVYITKHAHERYIERFGGVNSLKSNQKRENTIRKVVAFGIKLKPKKELMRLLRNKVRRVNFMLYRNIVVIHDIENDRAVTVMKYDRNEYHQIKGDNQ